ncbi:hypothetical protein [Cytobacillus sp. AMY 15.2]|uniref:hypothetical protein n=1 Tax=Cytobacillus sp. AMY 15.2 TaxID=2939563 RepID=UPI00203D2771|nr:hypothetical protein [Cytobacillus sp. AMY 15.2]
MEALDIKKKKMDSSHQTIFGQKVSGRPLTLNKFVNGLVCVDCNNVWLSQLESAVKPILLPLLKEDFTNEPLVALLKNKETFAKWAYKTVIILNRATNFHKIIPRRHYRLFHRTKRLPENTFVAFAVAEKPDINWVQTKTAMILGNDAESITKNPRYQDIYMICLQLNRVLIKVAYIPFYHYKYTPRENEIVLFPNIIRGEVKKPIYFKDISAYSIPVNFEQK